MRTVSVGQWPGLPLVEEISGHVIVTSVGPTYVASSGPGAGQAVAPDGNGRLSVLEGFSGAVLWSVPVGISPSAPAVDERTGHALVFNQGGSVTVADPWGWLPR